MNFFKTNADMKQRQKMVEDAQYIRRGGDLRRFTAEEVTSLQDYALDIKDIRLYDYLDKFWKAV